MNDLNILDLIGYALNVGVVGLAYWLLKVRDRLLALEKDYAHLEEKVDGGADDIKEIKHTLHDMATTLAELMVELRAKGTINGSKR